MKHLALTALLALLCACPKPSPASADAGMAAGECTFSETPAPEPRRHTPRWAFEPWISKDISDGADTAAFVEGFASRDIPVGVVVLDSPWETNYTTFVPNPSRYPAFAEMVADLRARSIRVVLWTTQMINETSLDAEPGGDTYPDPSPNLALASRCEFLVNDGAAYLWWKGSGSGLDFFSEAARAFWHREQDNVLNLGVAGFKLDFGEEYIPTPMIKTAAGMVTHQAYSEAYYRDFLAYGQHKLGADEFLTMVRPYDKSYQFEGRFFARPEHAPVGWVGDNRRDHVGMEDALDEMFRSAAAGYVVLGSDIGGYLDRDDHDLTGPVIPFDVTVFQRWTALGALNPLMQLHGRANVTPWTVPERVDETVAAYRYWASLHHALVPFFYSLSEEAYAHGGVVMHPVGDSASWPGDYRYLLGDALLVAPILQADGHRDVAFPSDAAFEDWWDGSSHAAGSVQTAYDATTPGRFPLFVRDGAIIPLELEDNALGFGSAAHAGHLTLLAWPAVRQTTFTLHEHDDTTTQIFVQKVTEGAHLMLSRLAQPLYARLRVTGPVTAVTGLSPVADKAALDAALRGWAMSEDGRFVWLKASAPADPLDLTVMF